MSEQSIKNLMPVRFNNVDGELQARTGFCLIDTKHILSGLGKLTNRDEIARAILVSIAECINSHEADKARIAELEQKVSELETALDSKWISIKDRLPEADQRVLTYSPNMDMKHRLLTWRSNLIEVTHWLPMPDAPSEENK